MGGSLPIKKFSLQIFRVLDGLFGHIFLKIPGKGGGKYAFNSETALEGNF